MNNSKLSNKANCEEKNDLCSPVEEDKADETKRIIDILGQQTRRAESGCVIKMIASELLEPESCERMRGNYVYGIISNLNDVCEITASRAYQINWSFAHLYTGNSFLAFVAPYFEHDFEVVKFPEEVDDKEDAEFSAQFEKKDDKWMIVECVGVVCEFCESHTCDRVQYRVELEEMLSDVALLQIANDKKRYNMYRRFTFMRHSSLGSGVRRKLDECVQELIVETFPVESGKRKRGYEESQG